MTLAMGTRQQAHDSTRIAELPEELGCLTKALTTEAVFVVDPEYRIVHWDARAESLTGVLAEELVGEPCYEALAGEGEGGTSFGILVSSVMRLAQAGRSASGYEVRLFTRSGVGRWVGVSSLALETEEGPYLVNLMHDAQAAHETLEMARGLIGFSGQDAPKQSPVRNRRDVPELTSRQLEVLRLLATGKSAREICGELFLSQATVRNHIRALLLALGAHSQLEALARAREAGLLDR